MTTGTFRHIMAYNTNRYTSHSLPTHYTFPSRCNARYFCHPEIAREVGYGINRYDVIAVSLIAQQSALCATKPQFPLFLCVTAWM